jgi:hypothetical protein
MSEAISNPAPSAKKAKAAALATSAPVEDPISILNRNVNARLIQCIRNRIFRPRPIYT